jgi:MFS family permease
MQSGAAHGQEAERRATYRQVGWRILPILFAAYIMANLDRNNFAFAKLQFATEFGFSEAVYGFGAGLFYLGYSLFEVPSNLMLAKVGARLTLLRIMLFWSLCSGALAFMSSATHFYALRFLLGVAEAGFFPGVLLYLTYWAPTARRAGFTALFMSALTMAGVIGGPIAGVILQSFDGALGLRGWQWLFLVEAVPARPCSASPSISISMTGPSRPPGCRRPARPC